MIQQLENRLANVVVENQDFETLIHHYDRPDTFFYLDPPYFSTEDMYAVEFAWTDHVRLRDTAANMQGRFLLSYNDCPEIQELYDGFPVFDFTRVHPMAQRYEAGYHGGLRLRPGLRKLPLRGQLRRKEVGRMNTKWAHYHPL